MGDTIKIEGLQELHRKLADLPARIEKNIVRSAVRAGAQVIRKAAAENIPGGGGKADIVIVPSRSKSEERKAVVFNIGPVKRRFYLYFLEMGTYMSFTGKYKRGTPKWMKNGRAPKGLTPRPWLRPAFDENVDKAIEAMAAQIRKRLEKEAKKA